MSRKVCSTKSCSESPVQERPLLWQTWLSACSGRRSLYPMVDLDSDPTKLIEVVMIGKQLLITRGALTTFSIANDVAKYFAIIQAMFAALYPSLGVINVMHLHSSQSAILSAIIFNAWIIIALIPLALRGVKYRPQSAARLLFRNLLRVNCFGLGVAADGAGELGGAEVVVGVFEGLGGGLGEAGLAADTGVGDVAELVVDTRRRRGQWSGK